MKIESIKLKGSLSIKVYDGDMKLKYTLKYKNLVVNTGKNYIAQRMTSNNHPIMSHMAVGSTDSVPVNAETSLGTEIGRVQLDSSPVSSNTISYVATFPAGVGTGSIKEIGIFNSNSAGTMLNKAQIDITKAPSDTIVVSWNLVIL